LKSAKAACIAGLEDAWSHASDLLALRRRLMRVQIQLRIPKRLQRCFDHIKLHSPQIISFQGTRVKLNENHRPLYSWDGELLSVEDYALNHYRQQGYQGFHSENSILSTLVSFLLMDEFFISDIPLAFETKFQCTFQSFVSISISDISGFTCLEN
jgi:Fanconi-associated nuclease 1